MGYHANSLRTGDGDEWPVICKKIFAEDCAVSGRREMNHIGPHRIFELSQIGTQEVSTQMTPEEKEHLRDCEECQRLLVIFANQFDDENPPYDHHGNP